MLEYKKRVNFMSSTGNRYSNEFKQQIVEQFQSDNQYLSCFVSMASPSGQSTNGQKSLHL
ncbi:hypothetical protein JN09_000345 [Acholeplasma morum]|uniref:hypothetical protein n=1 Tax=Paracholeplasma morum TaxID=264637 RepID=UPI001F3BCCC2|nr:hypothetical protein [Paracholeplasma morum]MBM7453026.1 hypothetical protein [Paracholeplasma morum]